MIKVFLDPVFTHRERRWGVYMETAMWLLSVLLLAWLIAWSVAAP